MAEEIRGYGETIFTIRKRLLCTPYYKNWASSGMFPWQCM